VPSDDAVAGGAERKKREKEKRKKEVRKEERIKSDAGPSYDSSGKGGDGRRSLKSSAFPG